jgi:hypothetical protein
MMTVGSTATVVVGLVWRHTVKKTTITQAVEILRFIAVRDGWAQFFILEC